MTRDDIIKMARDAGFEELFKDSNDWVCFTEEIERFSALVAAAEREACAKVCEAHKIDGQLIHSNAVVGCAAAIRARGQE